MQDWIAERYDEQDNFDFYAVNINEDPDHIAEYVEQIGLEVPVILGTAALFNQYRIRGGVSPYPVDYIIDGEGIVQYANHEYEPEIMLMVIDRLLDIGNEDERPIIHLNADTLDFETVQVNDSRILSVTLSNRGDADLLIDSVFVEGDIFAVDSLGEFSVQPDSSYTIDVTFTPSDTLLYSGTLTILSNDSTQLEAMVSLRGRGTSSESVNDDRSSVLPMKPYLNDAFPNPFNSSVIIRFDLPQSKFHSGKDDAG